MKKLLLLLIFCVQFGYSQFVPVDLESRKGNSTHIVQGMITSEKSFVEKDVIKTDFELTIETVLKGVINSNKITIRTLGGKKDGMIYIVCPSDELSVGLRGTFLLNKKGEIFETSFEGQSVVDRKIELDEDFVLHTSDSNRNTQSTMSITSISPSAIILGTGESLTITGSGFGATGPNSGMKVWVPTFDGAGMYALSDPIYYESWSDTEIKVKIPSSNMNNSSFILFGGGSVWVGNSATHDVSPTPFTVKGVVRDQRNSASTLNLPVTLPALADGGIKFIRNTNFTNATAIETMQYAIDNWVCNTGIKMSLDNAQTTTALASSTDGVSSLFFSNTLANNVLGRTLITINTCSSSGAYYVQDIDLELNSNVAFNYSRRPVASSQYDFYSTVLHELGHVRNLLHVNNSAKIMHPSITNGESKRVLHLHDIETGVWIQNKSQNVQTCNKPLMTPGVCSNLTIDEISDSNFIVYPNPTNDVIYIKNNIETIFIYNALGQEVGANISGNDSLFIVDLSSFESGTYFIKMKYQNLEKTVKVIKN